MKVKHEPVEYVINDSSMMVRESGGVIVAQRSNRLLYTGPDKIFIEKVRRRMIAI